MDESNVELKNNTKNIEGFSSIQKNTPMSLPCPGRTQGDGMENVSTDKVETKKTHLRDTLIYHPTNLNQSSYTPAVTPTGTIVKLIPTHVTQRKKEKILHSLKSKEPKFVPYEPYKASVNPIIPFEKKHKSSRNNLDINEMVAQMAIHKSIEMEKDEAKRIAESQKDNKNKELKDWEIEKKSYEQEIQNLKEENSQLENQLKFQAQVNGELKNLLVAAVGEDLETKVHLLTEDKLQLARALLNSAQHLSTHQEQTEWLAGQCEVWRSKFLASSLMVEELAKWKAALSQRTTDLQESIKRLLEERTKVRDTSLKTYKTLSILRENFDPVGTLTYKKHELPSTNIIDLADGCCQLAEILKIQLLSGMTHMPKQKEIVAGLEMKTVGEKNAEQLLMNPNVMMSGRQDAACSAVMGAAFALSGKMCLPSLMTESTIACCPHCSGEVKQV
ncbi:golgin-45 isoform X2 [Chelonus insularis]|uniref:golgin-45 isoform X2 n=1 Tax=Chelonus insularis TaxID=460826 RepID=UPI00158B0FC0|nr:golgin-45 isoform X2 [Chelonus insularis]XP_034940383.1 golgin-45 isoform X2 [Chelonus insularis]